MRGKQRILLAILGLAFAAPSAFAQQGIKIGVFDAERASLQTTPGQALHRRLNAQGQQFQQELEQLQEALNQLQQQYQATSLSLSEEKRRDLEREIEGKQIEFQTKQQAFLSARQRDVQSAQEEWSNQVRLAVEAIGKEGGYDLLLPSELVPFFSSSIDVTDKLIDRLGRAPQAAEPAAEPGS